MKTHNLITAMLLLVASGLTYGQDTRKLRELRSHSFHFSEAGVRASEKVNKSEDRTGT